jgi:hypothetical protein
LQGAATDMKNQSSVLPWWNQRRMPEIFHCTVNLASQHHDKTDGLKSRQCNDGAQKLWGHERWTPMHLPW